VIRARVTDDSSAIFTPCRYGVEDATLLDGGPLPDLREIVSFRGRFSDQVRAGEWTVTRGSLERVTPREKRPHCRLVVGGQAGDYLLAREYIQR
jgi:predicted nucleotidyltransferase